MLCPCMAPHRDWFSALFVWACLSSRQGSEHLYLFWYLLNIDTDDDPLRTELCYHVVHLLILGTPSWTTSIAMSPTSSSSSPARKIARITHWWGLWNWVAALTLSSCWVQTSARSTQFPVSIRVSLKDILVIKNELSIEFSEGIPDFDSKLLLLPELRSRGQWASQDPGLRNQKTGKILEIAMWVTVSLMKLIICKCLLFLRIWNNTIWRLIGSPEFLLCMSISLQALLQLVFWQSPFHHQSPRRQVRVSQYSPLVKV